MNTVLLILGIILTAMGLLLTVASPVPGIIGAALGIFFIVYSRKKKKAVPTSANSIPAEVKPAVQSFTVSSDNVIQTKVVGVTHKCSEDPSQNRQDILQLMSTGDGVLIEEYDFHGKPAFLVCDPKTGLDIGSLPAEVAEQLAGHRLAGVLSTVGSFIPDDSDEEIYYARIDIMDGGEYAKG